MEQIQCEARETEQQLNQRVADLENDKAALLAEKVEAEHRLQEARADLESTERHHVAAVSAMQVIPMFVLSPLNSITGPA